MTFATVCATELSSTSKIRCFNDFVDGAREEGVFTVFCSRWSILGSKSLSIPVSSSKSAVFKGMMHVNVVPLATVLSTYISPSNSSMNCLITERPKPAPL